MDKRLRDLQRIARAHGLHVERGRKHYQLRDDDGALVACFSVSSSDWRAARNLLSELRSATMRKVA